MMPVGHDASSVAPDEPPSYDEAMETIQPTILVLSGQSIHAESADAPPLYQFNRGIASLSLSTSEVIMERVERAVKIGADGQPNIKPRPRHIYNLKHSTAYLDTLPSYAPPFYISSVSRRTAGHMGLKKSRFRSRWKVCPIDISGKSNDHGLPQFIKDASPIYEIGHKEDRYEWVDSNSKAVAVEDEGEGQHRLIVTTPLQRKDMDALVAMWCCRLWQFSAEHQGRVNEGMDGVRRKLNLAREAPGGIWGVYPR
ncbi:hypothetical protein F5Y15DRAFT_245510 [Xylariaceae sp. FL0016]|nr:hypothetical protein F5Y15DRAFT_245510 [Xylariaceae sp. FL0016]